MKGPTPEELKATLAKPRPFRVTGDELSDVLSSVAETLKDLHNIVEYAAEISNVTTSQDVCLKLIEVTKHELRDLLARMERLS